MHVNASSEIVVHPAIRECYAVFAVNIRLIMSAIKNILELV